MTSHELALLKFMIEHPDAVSGIAARLSPEDMSCKQAGEIFSAIVDLASLGVTPDLVSIVDSLKARGVLESIGGASVVADVITSLPSASDPDYYIAKIRDAAKRKILKKLALELQTSADKHNDITQLCSEYSEKLISLVDRSGASEHLSEIANRFISALERGERQRLIPTFIPPLDALMGPMRPGELVIIAARPSVGKTAFAVNMSVLASENNVSSMLFSLEMPKDQIFKRMLCLKTGLTMNRLDVLSPRDDAFAAVVAASDELSSRSIFISDDPVVSANTVMKELGGKPMVDMIIIDYLQLMIGTKRSYDTRTQEVAAISHALKILARKLNVPVVALSQLNRNIELRGPGARPILADLRESGAIEQDADRVIFLHRLNEDDEMPFRQPVTHEQLLISVAKNRNGPTGDVVLTFDRRTMRICYD